jgi:hypothetical protein
MQQIGVNLRAVAEANAFHLKLEREKKVIAYCACIFHSFIGCRVCCFAIADAADAANGGRARTCGDGLQQGVDPRTRVRVCVCVCVTGHRFHC